MFVKFGDTTGKIFNNVVSSHNDSDSFVDMTLSNGETYNLGSGFITDRGVVIFDRFPNQDTSSVPIDHIIEIINTIYIDLFNGESIQFYIPKFSSNIYNETNKIQLKLLRVFKNITLIPV